MPSSLTVNLTVKIWHGHPPEFFTVSALRSVDGKKIGKKQYNQQLRGIVAAKSA
jgi:hypothetical protein